MRQCANDYKKINLSEATGFRILYALEQERCAARSRLSAHRHSGKCLHDGQHFLRSVSKGDDLPRRFAHIYRSCDLRRGLDKARHAFAALPADPDRVRRGDGK